MAKKKKLLICEWCGKTKQTPYHKLIEEGYICHECYKQLRE
ncbi:MAG: hypothetical protein ACFFDF_14155 [Candidatus Odinarchaeota archaeon]